MKRGRGYTQSSEERLAHVQRFIAGLHFSIPLLTLRAQQERRPCPRCHKRRLYYCYDCLEVTHPECHPPPLALPLDVNVILHPNELRGKSTSLAASTISPDLHIHTYPAVPEHLTPADTLVLYPGPDSVGMDEVDDLAGYKHVVFIDSTWQQSKSIARDERVRGFKQVRIKAQTSLFWRFQNNDPSYLATVEAIYYFLREYIVQVNKKKAQQQQLQGGEEKADTAADKAPRKDKKGAEGDVAGEEDEDEEGEDADVRKYYHGDVDDLLFYYINQYIGVQERYGAKGKMDSYTDRHFEGYILKDASWDHLVQGGGEAPQRSQEESEEKDARDAQKHKAE